MTDHYFDVAPDQIALRALPEILEEGERLAEMAKIIDFTDMIYLPTKWQLRGKTFEWVFVDECQDLNAAQLELVLSLRAPGGRFLFVGDPNQAIMGFAGADNKAFYKIANRTNATELPLSISYRCPVTHVQRAQKIVPQMEAADGASPGQIIEAAEDDLGNIVQEGDLILCRLTAPLVEACINLIKKKIPARVRGREIGKNLISMLEKAAALRGFSYDKIGHYLNKYKKRQTDLLIDREADESQIQSLHDRIDCLQVCAANYPEAKNIKQLSYHIQQLFNDERPSVWLSTVHRAKGLENSRVMILKPHKLPLSWPSQQAWQAEQEMNLRYVALTRSTDTLIFLNEKKKAKVQEEESEAHTEEEEHYAVDAHPPEAHPPEVSQSEAHPLETEQKRINQSLYVMGHNEGPKRAEGLIRGFTELRSDQTIAHLVGLVNQLVETAETRKYKGRHAEIKQLTYQIQEVLEAL